MDPRSAPAAPKQEIRLADYRPPAFRIEDVQLTFEIFERETRVTATSRIVRRQADARDLVLDGGTYMTLKSVTLDGADLGANRYTLESERLTVHDVPPSFELTVVTELDPFENTRLEGLYASGGNLCTQCEAEGFRHITYFLDRPDVLARYGVRIEADKARYPVLLSNGNPGAAGDLGQGRHFAEWQDPYPKPAYLFALVAGDLTAVSDQFTTKSGRDVALNIFVRAGDTDKCDYAMQSLKRSMVWDEEVFGLEYDLDVYNIVAVSDFNMGAMENKGLNIFNTKYVLANRATATDSDFDHVEGVIGHEYFHNWTGNRVTCRDWFQLSLKEGLTVYRDQEFSSDMTSRAVKRIEDVRVLRMLQFPEDAGPLAHPVRPESYIEINNFYTTTVYNKGAEVIRMMSRVVGEEAFRDGVKLYLERHDGEAATCEDFVAAIEDASETDLVQFRRWYSQAGTPTVTCRRQGDGPQLRLTVTQTCPKTPGQDTKEPFHMPLLVGWIGPDGTDLRPEIDGAGRWGDAGCLLELTEPEQSFTFKGVPEGAVPSLLRGFSAPVKLETDLSSAEQAHLLAHDIDPFTRWQSGQDLFAGYLLAAAGRPAPEPETLARIAASFEQILADQALDPALTAELLTLPGEIYLGQLQQVLDPDGLHSAREGLMQALADRTWDSLLRRYEALEPAAHGPSQDAKAARRLRNALLSYLARAKQGSDAASLVRGHYDRATNMTDQLAALTLIAHSEWPDRQEVLTAFYEQWREEELVIDKWFAVQGQSPRQDALETVRALMDHEAFTLSNPNRLRSLVSSFSMLNQVRFHDRSGAGYNLLSNVIAQVDAKNPQTAARMVAPLGRWARLDRDRRELMRASLEQLRCKEDLSDDVRELVNKSLT